MPAILKILIVFAGILLLARLRVQLGLALGCGGAALSLWAGAGLAQTARSLGRSFLDPELWLLLAITALIIEFGHFLTKEKNAEEIVKATQRWGGRHGPAATIMALPAIIGLIPMPAGALFSAPFVQQAGSQVNGPAAWKTTVNYWFRHIWEYWWPLYPGVIIAMSLFKLEAWRFIAAQILYTPVVLVTGYFVLVRPYIARLGRIAPAGGGSNRRAFFLLLPIAITVLFVFFSPFLFSACFPEMDVKVRKLLAVLVGLLLGVGIVLWNERRERDRRLWASLLSASSRNVLFTLTGVVVFKLLLEQCGLLPAAGNELVASGIPVVVAVAALPFIAGFVTGIALGFTGTAFPLVVGLMATAGSGLTPLATLVLAYGFGYMGMMLSPVHLCLLVTREYFSAPFLAVYRHLVRCALPVVIYSIIAYAVLHALGL